MLAKLLVAFNQKLLGNSDLVSNTVAEEDVYICPAGEKARHKQGKWNAPTIEM
jgi:hypothetical protein